jgi:hypothetical protein
VSAPRCPFCGASADTGLVSRLLDHGGKLSRAAVFAGAAACYTSSPPVQNPPPPPPPPDGDVQQQPPPDGTSTGFADPPPGDPATQLGQIEGWVSNAGGPQGMAGIPVYLSGQGVNQQATTDQAGRFQFTKLAPGSYTVHLMGNGNPRQAPPQQRVDVQPNATARVNLALYPSVPDRGPCCKPYGAPPARRRVV